MSITHDFSFAALLAAAALSPTFVAGTGILTAQDGEAPLVDRVLEANDWRELGPVNFAGRIVDIEVDPSDRFTFYAVSATGGIWKTVNNGTTFESVFEVPGVISIGDLAVAPSDPNVLYVGTGEANNQRSSYWGNGVHRSKDGGKTWKHVGLDGTDHIGRIVVHPSNPDIAFVAALGPLYRSGEHRGIYRTKDGGENWEAVQQIDADVGFVDVAIDPHDPNVILAASYDRRRRAWDFRDEGPGSAVWRSSDGGDSWRKVRGIPRGDIGRIGLAIHPGQKDLAFAIVENNNPAPTARPEREPRGDDGRAAGASPGTIGASRERGPAAGATPFAFAAARPIGGEVYRSTDGGKSWDKVSEEAVGGSPHYYYGQIRLDPKNPDHLWALGVNVYESTDGGKNWDTRFGRGLHVDHHALWIDPTDPRRALLGNDGGLAQTRDGGAHWDHLSELPLGQFYAVAVDLREPYRVYGGTQDNGTWAIPSQPVSSRALDHRDAYKIGGGDGFQVAVDPTDPNVVYGESQFGALYRVDLGSGARASIRPSSRRGEPRLRFNWMSPLLLSSHNPSTLYFGSQYVHRSRNRGDDWETISPDLTSNDPDRLSGDVPHCTVTAIAESPLKSGLLLAGTDDGRVWLTHDDGGRWTELTDRFEGVPSRLWVSRIETSPHDADRLYVAFTGYREDDRNVYLYLSTDGGESFRSIANDLPAGGSVNVVREHPRNENCVLVGTEFGVFASIDCGAHWAPLGKGLPTVAVHDLLVHPREPDVVVGTHGRGIWVLDATLLEDFDTDMLRAAMHVLPVRDGRRLRSEFPSIRYQGSRGWSADSWDGRAVFRYVLTREGSDRTQIEVFDVTGERVFSRRGEREPGLHTVEWRERGQRGRGAASDRPGDFLLRITRGEDVQERTFRVHPAASLSEDDEDVLEGYEELDLFAEEEGEGEIDREDR